MFETCDGLTQGPLALQPFAKAAQCLSYRSVLDAACQLAQFAKRQPTSVASQPDRRVAAPIPMPLNKLAPALLLRLLDGAYNLFPTQPRRQASQFGLLPRIAARL